MRAASWLVAAIAVVPRALALSIYDVATAEQVQALPQEVKMPLENFEAFIRDNIPPPSPITGQQCVKRLDAIQLDSFVERLRQLVSCAMSHPKFLVARIPRTFDYYYLPLGMILDYMLGVDPAKLGNAPRSSPYLLDTCKANDGVAFIMAKARLNFLQMAFIELVGTLLEPNGASGVDLKLLTCRQEIVCSIGVVNDLVMGTNVEGQRPIPNALLITDMGEEGWLSLENFLTEAMASLPGDFEKYREAVQVLCGQGLASSNVGLRQFAPFPLYDAARALNQVLSNRSLDPKMMKIVDLLDTFYARMGLEDLKLQFMLAPLYVQEHIEAKSSALGAIRSFFVSLIRGRDALKVLEAFDAVNFKSLKAFQRVVEEANSFEHFARQAADTGDLKTAISRATDTLFSLNRNLISEFDVKNPKVISDGKLSEKLKEINSVVGEGLAAVEVSIRSAYRKFETSDFEKFIVSSLGDWGIGKLLVAARIFAEATDMVIAKQDRYDFDKLLPPELFHMSHS